MDNENCLEVGLLKNQPWDNFYYTISFTFNKHKKNITHISYNKFLNKSQTT